jgi:hypothetical protein
MAYSADGKHLEIDIGGNMIRLNQQQIDDILAAKKLGALQQEFYKELHAAKEKGDISKITQAYLDRLVAFVKANPRNPETPGAIRQIVLVYDSQGKTVEAGAWREKLLKEQLDPARKQPVKDLTTPPPVELKGVIEAIDPNDASRLSISIGSDAGLSINHTLEVYRLKPAPAYLGMIRIIDLTPQKAVARRIGNANLPPYMPILQVGDEVTSSLTGRVEKEKQ